MDLNIQSKDSSICADLLELPTKNLLKNKIDSDLVKLGVLDLLKTNVRPSLNFGSFTTTEFDRSANDLLSETCGLNAANSTEYSALTELQNRCLSIIARLWNSPTVESPVGCVTSGSSESLFLAVMALKITWQIRNERRGADGKRLNLILPSHSHVGVTKLGFFCDLELRMIPVTSETGYTIDVGLIRESLDEYTVGVVLTAGTTFTGHFDPIDDVADILDSFQSETGFNIPIHVDAASGGFIAPFVTSYNRNWGFCNPRVVSINASGHKFGMTTCAVGWLLWRDKASLPDQMNHQASYLMMPSRSCTLSFSRPGSTVALQYYHFSRLGHIGYEELVQNLLRKARQLSSLLEATGWFNCLSDIHRHPAEKTEDVERSNERPKSYCLGTPVVAFRLCDIARKNDLTEELISQELWERGVAVPCASLTVGENEYIGVLRIVVRHHTETCLLNSLVAKIIGICINRIAGSQKMDDKLPLEI